MTKKKFRHKPKWNKVKEAHLASRSAIGAVPPSRPFKDSRPEPPKIRASEFSGLLEDADEREKPIPGIKVTVGGRPVEEILEEEKERDRQTDTREAYTTTHVEMNRVVRSHIFTGQQQRPSSRTTDEGRVYSAETTRHYEFLLASEGEVVAKQFLDRIKFLKGGSSMATESVQQENGRTQDLQQQIGKGPIEQALEDAKAKVKYYTAEEQRCRDEKDRYEKLAIGLEAMLLLATSKAPRSQQKETSLQPRTLRPRGQWKEDVELVLREANHRMRAGELVDELQKLVPGSKRGSVYQTIYSLIEKGFIIKDENKYLSLAKKEGE